jgi:hypothetical protein
MYCSTSTSTYRSIFTKDFFILEKLLSIALKTHASIVIEIIMSQSVIFFVIITCECQQEDCSRQFRNLLFSTQIHGDLIHKDTYSCSNIESAYSSNTLRLRHWRRAKGGIRLTQSIWTKRVRKSNCDFSPIHT